MKHDDFKRNGEAHLSRRSFLQRSGLVSAAGLTASAWLSPLARAAGAGGPRDVLVQVFLRGGMDGLTTCVPHGDGELYAARPNLAVPPPGATDGALDLDGFFGLAPSAKGLMTPYSNGHLAIVHAAGSTDPTRSHFDAFKAMESGYPEQNYTQVEDGWLARHLVAASPAIAPPLRAVALADTMPQHLQGAPDSLPIADAEAFAFPGKAYSAEIRRRVIQRMYQGATSPLDAAAESTIETLDLFEGIDFAGYAPGGGASYPDSPFGTRLKQTAALIKAEVGLEAVSIDYGGWDHHNQLGPIDGTMAGMLAGLANSIEAFYLDMRHHLDSVTLVVVSEFGRRVAENGSLGADHGHGNCMFVLGGHVLGGQVYGAWPTLAPAALDDGDLAITTDYRDVLGEVLTKRMSTPDLGLVFPNHTPSFLNLIA